jgi:ATP/maltotriose-dependent transcriptional regulator MalT
LIYFDATFNHRFIIDYLVEEVLQRQPERIRSFLLQTSVLDRLCGSLCDAVTGEGDGSGMLEALECGNLFVVPLDDQRQWYRYHHLFADMLQARLYPVRRWRRPPGWAGQRCRGHARKCAVRCSTPARGAPYPQR